MFVSVIGQVWLDRAYSCSSAGCLVVLYLTPPQVSLQSSLMVVHDHLAAPTCRVVNAARVPPFRSEAWRLNDDEKK